MSMELVGSLLLLGLLSGLIGYPEPATGATFVSSSWPPRTAQDLVLLLQGTDPRCMGSGQTTSVALKRIRQLLEFVPQLITSGGRTEWLYGALEMLVNTSSTKGDLKHLLVWGISQNLSWDFLNLPLVTTPSIHSQFLNLSMKSDFPTFLKICSDRLLPALKNICNSVNQSLQSLCLVFPNILQSSQLDTQFCTIFFSSLSDLLSNRCHTRMVRDVGSVTANCVYTTWYNSSSVSPSDVSTCSEIDQDVFILSVCGDQKLLNQLANQSDNNWLLGYCAYNTNPKTICHYVYWEGHAISAFSVVFCWLNDQEQFTTFLCTNANVLAQLKENVDNQWLNPICPTVPPTNIASTNLVQDVCSYEQWLLQIINPSTVAFCAESDEYGFTNYVCKSFELLQKLLIDESNSWVAMLCQNVMPATANECNYTLWDKTDNGTRFQLLMDPSVVTYCSQEEEDQFVLYVCKNISLLFILSTDSNNNWVRQFCTNHICNYTSWNSSIPTFSTVDLCWIIDQEELNLYLCSNNNNVLQSIELTDASNVSCPANSTNMTVCSYNIWNLTELYPSMLGYCAIQDAPRFQKYICGNSFLVTLLKNNSETSWVSIFCHAQINGSIANCTDSLLSFHLQSCPDCARAELEDTILSVCNNQNLVAVLSLFWNTSALVQKFILWNLCDYSSWATLAPPPFLVSYCWKFDNITLSDFLCSNFQLYDELLQEGNIEESQICDPNKTCQYLTWDLTTLQSSLVKYCAHWDTQAFIWHICSNSTNIKFLSENRNLTWVNLLCFGSILPTNTSNVCNYEEWLSSTEGGIEPVVFSTVYSCSKNDTMNFMMNVCNNSQTLSAISEGPALSWALIFCSTFSSSNVLTQMLIWDVCDYSQTMTFTPLMVEFCWLYSQENFTNYLCSNLTFYAQIKIQPQNFWLQSVCTPLLPTMATGLLNYSVIQCQNQYSNLTNMDFSLIKFCAEFDQDMFLNTFCNVTTVQPKNISCLWGNELCSYYSWHGAYIHPIVVKACWASDELNFMSGVCSDPILYAQLLLNSANLWLRPVCGTQNTSQFENLVKAVCRYKEWGVVSSVPGSIVAFCSAYDHEMYMYSICDNQQEAICNDTIQRWWDQDHNCNYSNWEIGPIDPDETLMCFVLEKENFTAHVCKNSILLSKFSNDSRTTWVAHVCSITSVLNETDLCLTENYKEQLEWNCSVDLSSVCPGNGLTLVSFLPISICYLQNAGLNLSILTMTTLYTQAVDTTIILLLLLEDMQILSLANISGIQAQVLDTLLNFISKETSQNHQKTELLQTFGNTLLLLMEEESPSYSWTIIEALFNLTVSELRVCISSLQPKSAKYFLSILLQNQTSLQVSDDYFSMIVSTLLSVQVPSEPLLFCDIVAFLHYLEADELIRLLPPLQDNKEVLLILSRYAGALSHEQRVVLGFWLRQSTLVKNLTRMDDIFIQQVGNLLPLFSLDVFLLLSAQQVVTILPSLPGDLTPPYQKVVASKVLQAPNITVRDVELMGRYVCQADVQDLEPYGQNVNISLALRRNLFQCVTRGDLFPDSMMLEFLFGDQQSQDLGELSSDSVPNLSMAICSLGYNFLQSLSPERLMPVLSDVASVTLTAAQAQEIVQKVLNPGNVSDEVLAHMGSLVLGISPAFLQQLSHSQVAQLLPALTSNADLLSSAQTLAVFRTLWESWNISHNLNELGPLLPSLPLIMLRTRSKEVLSNLSNVSSMAGVRWNEQQALLLIREVTQGMRMSDGVRSTVTPSHCDSLISLLQDNLTQAMEQFHDIINALPQHVIRCALDKVIALPPSITLLKSLSSQMIAEIQPSTVSLLPANSCRYVLQMLKSEAQSVAALPQQRRFGLLDALISCLNSAGTIDPRAQFIILGSLAPFLKGSVYLTLSQGMMLKNVERVTNYCYPQETWLPLSQLLQESQSFGSPTLWTPLLLERLDRLVPLLPLNSLQSLNMAALSSCWLFKMLSEERLWRKSELGTACTKGETVDQRAENMQKQRTLLQRLFLARSMSNSSVLVPECANLRGSIVSAWGVEVLLSMTPVNFMDCLEQIGQDPDIPNSELAPLLTGVLKIAGPVSVLPKHVVLRLGRLATKLSVKQLKVVSLEDLQVVEAFGNQQEWTMSQLNTLVNRFLKTYKVTAKDLTALHLVTLGYLICGLPEIDIQQITPLEFCSAIMYLGQFSLSCTELQLEALVRLCTGNAMFGPVSGWTEDIFLEIGSVAAGLQDIELSSLVLEQIQGLTPLAISLIFPKKFAVSFSSQQLQLFSWSQAKAVTEQQKKLLDNEQTKALTLALIEDSGNQTYRAGKSQAGHCSYCAPLHLSALLPVLHVFYIVTHTVVCTHVQ